MQLSSLSLLRGAVVFTCFLAVDFGETLVMACVFVIWKCLDLVKIFRGHSYWGTNFTRCLATFFDLKEVVPLETAVRNEFPQLWCYGFVCD